MAKLLQKKLYILLFYWSYFNIILVSTNFSDSISIRIAIGSGLAFFISQSLDVKIFDLLRKKLGT